MKNKKTIMHFTLAVALIVGVCATAKSKSTPINTSNYLSNNNKNQSIDIVDSFINSDQSIEIDKIDTDAGNSQDIGVDESKKDLDIAVKTSKKLINSTNTMI